jgi:uncharacterized membrane protein YeiB
MLCAVLVTRHRLLLAAAALITLPALGVWGWVDGTIGLGQSTGYAAASAPDYLAGVGIRAPDALRDTLLAPIEEIGLLSPMALGALMARARLLEDVPAHRLRLTQLTRWGLAVGLLGAVPLTAVLVLDPAHAHLDSELLLGILGVLHQLSGLVGGIGLAAVAALVAERFRERFRGGEPGVLGRLVRGIEALGAVSLSAYLAQSLLCLVLFPPYTLDLGAQLGTAGAAVLVLAGWLVMLPLAALLARRGRRGPMEHVLRVLAGSGATRAGDGRASRDGGGER